MYMHVHVYVYVYIHTDINILIHQILEERGNLVHPSFVQKIIIKLIK